MGKDADKSRNQPPAWWRFVRYSLVIVLTGLVLLAWVSVLSFSINDPPARRVYPPQAVHNLCGQAGAYLAYGLFYWFGDGTYMLLLFATVVAAVRLLGGRVGELYWRLAGLALMVTATAAAAHLIQPAASGAPAVTEGGILGIGVGNFLLSRFAGWGTWIVLVVTFGVAAMLTADKLVLQLPGLGRRLWQRHGKTIASGGKAILDGGRAALATLARPAPAPAGAGQASASAGPVAQPAPRIRPTPIKREPGLAPATTACAVKPPDAAPIAANPGSATVALPTLRLALPRPPASGQPAEAEERPARAQRERPAPRALEEADGQYRLPSIDLLADPAGGYIQSQEAQVEEKRAILQQTLDDFGVQAQVVGHMTGPVISQFELSVAPGVKVSQIQTLAPDMARALAVPGVRVVSPLPGRDTVGIEVPNLDKEVVRLKELMSMAPEAAEKMQLPLYLGKDAGGEAIVADLAGMPHLLMAGTTGSGKSVCINSIIAAVLLTRAPRDVRLILIDPKMVEMAAFERIPHLLCPIVNDMRRVEDILEWAAVKMDERYEMLKEAGVRNIAGFNALSREEIHKRFGAQTDEEKSQVVTHMQYIVIIIDELADLIMTASKEVEGHIIRIAQKARAVGIHLIVATQRPSVNVVTGLIKSNMPCRISFRVASRQESRIVLDQNGADVLLGQGDMLFLQPGTSHLIRAQGTYVDEHEVRALVNHVRQNCDVQYLDELVKLQSGSGGEEGQPGEKDELFDQAVEIILANQRGSVSLLQRRLQVGYSRASRIVDQMAEVGILGDYKGSQARECLMSLEDWQATKANIAADQSGASAANGEPTSA